MTAKPKCSACGSDRVIPDATIVDHNYMRKDQLTLEVYERPKAAFFKGGKQRVVHAAVCGDCGQVDLWVGNPGSLYEFYLRHRR